MARRLIGIGGSELDWHPGIGCSSEAHATDCLHNATDAIHHERIGGPEAGGRGPDPFEVTGTVHHLGQVAGSAIGDQSNWREIDWISSTVRNVLSIRLTGESVFPVSKEML